MSECFFWCWLTRVLLDKGLLNGCVYVNVSVSVNVEFKVTLHEQVHC